MCLLDPALYLARVSSIVMSSPGVEQEAKPPFTETSSCTGESDDTPQPTVYNANDDPGRDGVERVDRGDQYDVEGQKSHRVSSLPLSISLDQH